jgi:hypothetical protein
MEDAIGAFCTRLCELHPELDSASLKEMWNVVKKKKSLKKKMNCYNLFTKEQSCEIKREHPSLSFGDRAREVGRRWKALSSDQKDKYKYRARLYEAYQHHDGWDTYMEKPRAYLLHIAKNWFEDDLSSPSIRIHDDMSKEEVVELLLLHTHVDGPTSSPSSELSPAYPNENENDNENLEALSYEELLDRLSQRFPGYCDNGFTSKQDLIDLLNGHLLKKEERIPLEVHPYYYQLLQKSLDALHHLCDKNFAPEMWKGNATDRRKLMELLVRHFDHLELE